MNKPIDFYDIYDYHYTPIWAKTWFHITIAVILLAVATALIVFLIMRKKRSQQAPWEWALAKLTQFSTDTLDNKKDFKNFYFDLTSVIKIYLHKRFNWSTQDKTDQELIALLEKNKLDPKLISMIEKTAEGALWIKYANEAALRSQADEDLKTAHQLIEKTKEENKSA